MKDRIKVFTRNGHDIYCRDNSKQYKIKRRWHNAAKAFRDFGKSVDGLAIQLKKVTL